MSVPELKEGDEHWHRFEDGDRGHRKHIPDTPREGESWVVLWDGQEKFHFTSYPNNWGGSGWYADPQDVIAKPSKDI